MLLGEWRDLLQRDPETGWVALYERFLEAARSAGQSRAPADDPCDVASECLVRVMARRPSAARARPSTRLDAWASGFVRNVMRERARDTRRRPQLQARPMDDLPGRGESPVRSDAIDLSRLTRAQRDAVARYLAGDSQRQAAAKLRISRAAYRERLERGAHRLAKAPGARAGADRSWAIEALRDDRSRDRTNRAILVGYLAGESTTENARRLGRSKESVRGRRRRIQAGVLRARRQRPDGASP